VQYKRLHEGSQPIEKMEKIIEEIIKLMIRSIEETVSMRKLNKGELAIVEEKEKKKQQQQHNIGAGGQFQGEDWDPRGFQWSWGSHEQEIMNFSQQWSMMQENPFTSPDAPRS
jgi:hypothetical protein